MGGLGGGEGVQGGGESRGGACGLERGKAEHIKMCKILFQMKMKENIITYLEIYYLNLFGGCWGIDFFVLLLI